MYIAAEAVGALRLGHCQVAGELFNKLAGGVAHFVLVRACFISGQAKVGDLGARKRIGLAKRARQTQLTLGDITSRSRLFPGSPPAICGKIIFMASCNRLRP